MYRLFIFLSGKEVKALILLFFFNLKNTGLVNVMVNAMTRGDIQNDSLDISGSHSIWKTKLPLRGGALFRS